MSPEEEYVGELKWVLQKIKKALLTAGPDGRVDFNASRLTNRDPNSPSLDAIYNQIMSLRRNAVLRIVERYDGDGFSAYASALDEGAGVTGYVFIVDQQKFNALYEKYFKPRLPESDKSFNFENEKQNIAVIDSADEYKIIADKWLNIKQILDALFKLLSPIDTSEVQTVTLNPRYLSLEQGRLFTSVLSDMIKAGAIGGTHKIAPPVVITSAMATSLTSGKYIPLNVAVFKAYRKKVVDLVAWIETDQARFSKSDGVITKENEKREGNTEAKEVSLLSKSAKDKILKVLEVIHDRYELTPKEPQLQDHGMTATLGDGGGKMRIVARDFLAGGEINFHELEAILGTLKEEGLLNSFKLIPEYR